jgi:hypothetical protein
MKLDRIDPFDSIAPILSGRLEGDHRRQVLRALLGAGMGAVGLFAGHGASAQAEPRAAADPLANDRRQDWAKSPGTPAKPGKLPFVRVYAGADRITRVERRDIELTAEPTPGLFIQRAETFAIRVIPPGTSFDWHKPSRRRMVAVLRGSSTLILRDGTTATVLPGTLSLVENLDSDGHRGEFDRDDYTITMDVGLPAGA